MRKVRFVGMPILLFGVIWGAALGLVIVSLWNILLPVIFGLPVISYWQALGLLVLSRALFGGFMPKTDKMRFVRGWKDLTPDERQRFRRAMEGRMPERPIEG